MILYWAHKSILYLVLGASHIAIGFIDVPKERVWIAIKVFKTVACRLEAGVEVNFAHAVNCAND